MSISDTEYVNSTVFREFVDSKVKCAIFVDDSDSGYSDGVSVHGSLDRLKRTNVPTGPNPRALVLG